MDAITLIALILGFVITLLLGLFLVRTMVTNWVEKDLLKKEKWQQALAPKPVQKERMSKEEIIQWIKEESIDDKELFTIFKYFTETLEHKFQAKQDGEIKNPVEVKKEKTVTQKQEVFTLNELDETNVKQFLAEQTNSQFFPPPDENGLFYGRRGKAKFKALSTPYQFFFSKAHEERALFRLVDEVETIKNAFKFSIHQIDPACRVEGEEKLAQFAKMNFTWGIAKKVNNNWKVIQKTELEILSKTDLKNQASLPKEQSMPVAETVVVEAKKVVEKTENKPNVEFEVVVPKSEPVLDDPLPDLSSFRSVYAKAPTKDGHFSKRSFSDSISYYQTIYQVYLPTKAPFNIAYFTLTEDEAIREFAFEFQDTALAPACILVGNTKSSDPIIDHILPGKLSLENNEWKMMTKVTIRLK